MANIHFNNPCGPAIKLKPNKCYESDFVSLIIYTWDSEFKDISLIFHIKDNESDVFLPSKKVDLGSAVKNCIKHECAKKCNCKILVDKFSSKDKLQLSNCAQWKATAQEILKDILDESVVKGQEELLHLLRFYSPIKQRHFCHVIFGIKVSIDCLTPLHGVKNLVFLARKQLYADGYVVERNLTLLIIENLYKILILEQKQSSKDTDVVSQVVENVTCGSTMEEIDPSIYMCKNNKDANSPLSLFDSPGYTLQERERLFEAFEFLSYPHSTVRFNNIEPLLTELGFKGMERKAFRAMDEHRMGEITLIQFMLGLTAMDPLTHHGSMPGEFRCRHIFRFYDKDADNYLDESDLKEMIIDILNCQKQTVSEELLVSSVYNAFKIFGVPPSEKVSLAKFLMSVGNLKFRGTSLLYRAAKSVPEILKGLRDPWAEAEFQKSLKMKKPPSKLDFNSLPNSNKGFDPLKQNLYSVMSQEDVNCKNSFGYMLAEHTVTIKRSGTISNVSNLLDMERAGEVCNTGLDSIYELEESSSVENKAPIGFSTHLLPNFGKRKVEKQFSAQAFDYKSLPNEMIIALRYFEMSNSSKLSYSWGIIDKVKLARYIITLCDSVREIFESETRLLHISAPCYILGDLHGNFQDLICFEKALWRLGPHLTPANFLFLGDYVDRGNYGLEVVMYLLAQKLRAPNRFHLLRGNHEERVIQKTFTFYNECVEKFDESLGVEVWENINQVFDRMPLAAIVDKKIFCIHGGIPRLEGTIEEIDLIPTVLSNPSESLAWQLMWNDPIAPEDMNDATKKELAKNGGFARNAKRKTAYVFDEKAFNSFLIKNNLSHVIRAHEVKMAGFEIQQNGRLFTVFSSSQYSGINNEAACILVHDYRIRAIRIDTAYKQI